MGNKRKKVNPLITERLNELIKESDKSIRWLCENVLFYESSNFSRFTKGVAQPPDYILDALAEHFGVRKEWLYGIDDYKTILDCVPHSSQEIADIIKNSKNILNNFGNPLSYQNDMENSILHFFDINGFTPYTQNQLYHKNRFLRYMESSIRNSIEFYMNNLNRKDGE